MKSEKKICKRKGLFLVAVILAAAAICGAVIWGLVSCNQKTDLEIETTYLTIRIPKEYKEFLAYEENLDGQNSEVVFFMSYEEKKLELFRLSVSSNTPERFEGYLNTQNGVMYVALTDTQVDRGVFSTQEQTGEVGINTEMEALYYSMKDIMSAVMRSVEETPGYSVVMGLFENEKKDAKMSYWTVSLPSGITWEEKTEGSVYRAVFYGNVGQKRIPLYTISLGDTTAENPIGQLVISGEPKLVSVEVHDLNENGALADEERSAVYAFMGTVNDVLQAIRQDKNFRDQLEPVA